MNIQDIKQRTLLVMHLVLKQAHSPVLLLWVVSYHHNGGVLEEYIEEQLNVHEMGVYGC
jgi:hypothetical protein